MSWLRLMEERIKREHHEPGKKHGETTLAKKKNRVMELVMEMWPAYLIEIFVIIIGIWITVAVEQWRDNSKEAQLEKVYQKNLLRDINTDEQSLKYSISNTQDILAKGDELLNFVKQPATTISAARADSDLQMMLARPRFITSDATFSDLKNSGNLHLLKDVQLKNLLFSYYSMAQNIKETQDAEQQATIIVTGPYFFKHFAMGAIGNRGANIQQLRSLGNDAEFGNNLLLRLHTRNELLDGYSRADSLAAKVKKVLEVQIEE